MLVDVDHLAGLNWSCATDLCVVVPVIFFLRRVKAFGDARYQCFIAFEQLRLLCLWVCCKIRISCIGWWNVECGRSRWTSSDDKAERCGFGGPKDLRVVRVIPGLLQETSSTLMGGDVLAKAGYNHIIIAFYLFISLWMVNSSCLVFISRRIPRGPNSLLTDCIPLSVRRWEGILYEITHALKNIHAIEFLTTLAVRTALFRFEQMSLIISTCW